MDFLTQFIDFFLHLDIYLSEIISNYGVWTYLILFAIIFVETGFVIMPFLPGDSLLFAAGAFAALGVLNPLYLIILLFIAAFLGDTLNYFIGKSLGPKVFNLDSRFLKKEYLIKTQAFYEKHGGKTIVLARFIPIIRTFAPFIAGVGTMSYGKFITYNIIGGICWIASFILLGYYFGNLPLVKKNFTLVVFAIIFLSILPPIIELVKEKFTKKAV